MRGETRGHGDTGTRGHGDTETRRHGDAERGSGGELEQEHRLVVHAQVAVGAVALAGARDMDTGGAGEAEHEQGDRMPVRDGL